jgi:hypothetical protein
MPLGRRTLRSCRSRFVEQLPAGIVDKDELDKVLGNWGSTVAALCFAAAVAEPRTYAVAIVSFWPDCFAARYCRSRSSARQASCCSVSDFQLTIDRCGKQVLIGRLADPRLRSTSAAGDRLKMLRTAVLKVDTSISSKSLRVSNIST